MNIKKCRMFSGKVYVIYYVKSLRNQLGDQTWRVLCGREGMKPKWTTLMTNYNRAPYLWIDGVKLYLSDFNPA